MLFAEAQVHGSVLYFQRELLGMVSVGVGVEGNAVTLSVLKAVRAPPPRAAIEYVSLNAALTGILWNKLFVNLNTPPPKSCAISRD